MLTRIRNAARNNAKVVRCLKSLLGISLSRGGCVHTVLRAASRCEPVYEGIRRAVYPERQAVSELASGGREALMW